MNFEYSPEEELLFERIHQRVTELLDLESATITLRYRKFNYSIETPRGPLHVKTFYQGVIEGQPQKASWTNTVVTRTKIIYQMIDQDKLDISVPELVLIDTDWGIIITKMVAGTGLHQLLMGDDPQAATDGLLLMARSLAQLHATTYQRQVHFLQLWPDNSLTEPINWVRWNEPGLEQLIEVIPQVSNLTTDQVTTLIRSLQSIRTLAEQSPQISLVNSDPCPDNLLIDGQNLTMIDLDTFSFYYFFIDVYFLWVRASCWCVGQLEPEQMELLEQTYLQHYRTIRPLSDTDFYNGLLTGALLWTAVDLTMQFRSMDDRLTIDREEPWGLAQIHQRHFSRIRLLERQYHRLLDYLDPLLKQQLDTVLPLLKILKNDMRERFKDELANSSGYVPLYPAFS